MTKNTSTKNSNPQNTKAKKQTTPQIKAKIDKMIENHSVKAFASITIGGAVAIHGIRVMDSEKGMFIAMPLSSYENKNGEKKYREVAHPITKEARDILDNVVMKAYEQTLEEQQAESEDETESEDESFTQSM